MGQRGVIGGFTSKPNKLDIAPSRGIVDQGIGTNVSGFKNLAIKEALEDAGIGTGGQGGPYVAMEPEMLQGGSYQPAPPAVYQGGSYQPAPTSIFDGGGFQEGVSGDLDPDFGMTPQAPRQEYFGPTNWNPGIGNQYHVPDLIKEYEQKVAESGSILDTKQIKKAAKQQAGQKFGGHPSEGVTYPTPSNIIQAVQGYAGHPSAGVTYPQPSYVDPIQRIDTIDQRIKDKLDFEDFGTSEVFPTEDMGKWYEPGIPEGDIRARMALEQGYAQPHQQDINTTLTAAQIDAIQNPALQAPSVFDEPLVDGRGTFAESNFVGPHDYAYGNIQDASSTLDPRVLAGLNQQAIGHMTDPSGVAGYVEGLPQPPLPEVNESRIGYVDPRHMDAYNQMIGQTGELPAEVPNMEPIFTGPQGVAPADETVDLSRDIVRQPWSHPSAGVTYPKQRERDSQLELLEFYETVGMGNSQVAIDLKRAIGLN